MDPLKEDTSLRDDITEMLYLLKDIKQYMIRKDDDSSELYNRVQRITSKYNM